MNALETIAYALAGFAAWSTRRRWMPPALLEQLGEAEDDQAPDLIDQAAALPSLVTDSFVDVLPEEIPVWSANERAFLDAIAWSEGTDRGVSRDDSYRVLYGHLQGRPSLAETLDDHPANLGWRGVRLPDAMCQAAGFGPGCVSTAAGRYQFVRPTWNRLAAALNLRDFGPASQDLAALRLVQERGALSDVRAGRFDVAVGKVRRIWASLPGAGYGQGERSLVQLRSVFVDAGGYLEA